MDSDGSTENFGSFAIMKTQPPVVAGNWKMNKTVEEARTLVSDMISGLASIKGVEKILCPPFTSLLSIAALIKGTDIGLGAQDMHWETQGAFTGAISPDMVAEFCEYVIIGHSERRTYFYETDGNVNKKVLVARERGLIPIVCVGETLAEYDSGRTADVISRQISLGLRGLDSEYATRIIIAYEPVWAIGTGRASSGENAQAVLRQVIRPALSVLFGDVPAESIRIIYGGSVNSINAMDFFNQPDISGALVGGASLKKDEFIAIVNAAAQ